MTKDIFTKDDDLKLLKCCSELKIAETDEQKDKVWNKICDKFDNNKYYLERRIDFLLKMR